MSTTKNFRYNYIMLFLNVEYLHIVLLAMVLVRVLLNRSGFTALVIVCFTASLSFVFFESPFAILPLLCYFLKESFLDLITWAKTVFFNLKNFLFFGNKEEEKDTVLAMEGKKEVTVTPDKTPTPVGADPQSATSEDNPSEEGEGMFKVRLVGPSEKVYAEVEFDSESVINFGIKFFDSTFVNAFMLVLCRSYVASTTEMYKIFGPTAKGVKVADRRVAAMGAFILAAYCITNLTGNRLSESTKRGLKNLFNGGVRIDNSSENVDKIETAKAKVAEITGGNRFLATSVSEDVFEVSEDKVTEFLVKWLKELNELLEKGEIDINLNGSLPQEDQIRLISEYRNLSDHGKLFLKDHCGKLYTKIIEIEGLIADLAGMDLTSPNTGQSSFSRTPNTGQSSFSRGQDALPGTSEVQRSIMPGVKQVEFGSLPDPDYPGLTVRESLEQQEEDVTPKDCYETFSTTFSPQDYRKHELAQSKGKLERAESLKGDYRYPNKAKFSSLETQHNEDDFSSVSNDSPGRSPGSRNERLFTTSHQDFASIPIPPSTSESEILCKDKENLLSSSNDDLSFSPSPLEPLEEKRYLGWLDFGLGVGILITTSQAALTVIRKLNYTQELVKRMINWGCPPWLISWFPYSNQGPPPEKPLFHLMMGVLLGNFILLYVLMRMIHLIS